MHLTPFQTDNAALALAIFVKACRLCGGRLMDPRLDEHALCAVRARRGAPTPSLGDPCTQCGGVGCLPRSKVGPVNPNQRAIEAWAPTCDRCHGTRAEPGTVADPPTLRADAARQRTP